MRSFWGTFCLLFEFSEFFLVGLLFCDGCIEGAVGVVWLIDVEDGIVEGCPKGEGQAEDEELIQPTEFESFADNSPSAFDCWGWVPLRDDLWLSA